MGLFSYSITEMWVFKLRKNQLHFSLYLWVVSVVYYATVVSVSVFEAEEHVGVENALTDIPREYG